jgi:parvulin-like peptidyl-prolyl isomerase
VGRPPEFEKALIALALGELCAEPVATRYGFHLFQLDRKHEGRTLPTRRSPVASLTIFARVCGAAPILLYCAARIICAD